MLARIATLAFVGAFAFTAPALAEEAAKQSTLSFVKAKNLNKAWLSDGHWIDMSKGVDCDQYVDAYNKANDSKAIANSPEMGTPFVEVTNYAMQFTWLPEGELTCTAVKEPLKTGPDRSMALTKCASEGGNGVTAYFVQMYDTTHAVLTTASFDPIKRDMDVSTLSATALKYCGKPKLTPAF